MRKSEEQFIEASKKFEQTLHEALARVAGITTKRAIRNVKAFVENTKFEEQDIIIKVMIEHFPDLFGSIDISTITVKDRLNIFLVLALEVQGTKDTELKSYYDHFIENAIIERDLPTGGGKVNGG